MGSMCSSSKSKYSQNQDHPLKKNQTTFEGNLIPNSFRNRNKDWKPRDKQSSNPEEARDSSPERSSRKSREEESHRHIKPILR